MFQVITAWNLISPEKEFYDTINRIELRGYNKETFLTGEFADKVASKKIRPLSVTDIADFLCPVRRDLYLKKGKNRPRITRKKTWGSVSGRVVENYIFAILREFYGIKQTKISYSKIGKKVERISTGFKRSNRKAFKDLGKLRGRPDEDPDWLLKLLSYTGRAELGFKLLHTLLSSKENDAINIRELEVTSPELKPNPSQIGISSGVKPDFLIKKKGVVGDIKAGMGGFKDRYLLTCAGYALAYENEKRADNNINYGIIYFFPTRYSEYAKPVSFAHVYVFPIDDGLRDYFLKIRNEAYRITSKDAPPDFPKETNHCPHCQFIDFCLEGGLRL